MKRARVVMCATIAASLGGAVVLTACVDLFHSTSFQTLCDVDATAPGCGSVDGGPTGDAPVSTDAADGAISDFCALDSSGAQSVAAHACAWLGACDGPYEHNSFARCVLDALQVYDCTIRPNMRPTGPILAYWNCLANVKSCTDVDQCVTPHPNCPSNPYGVNACAGDTRVACAPDAAQGSPAKLVASCGAQGRHCYQPDPTGDSVAYCAASDTSMDAGCNSGCAGSVLHDCEDIGVGYSVDLGRDCKNIGAGSCTTTGGGQAVCAPKGTACKGAGISCSQAVAVDCRSGFEDRVDCSKFGSGGDCMNLNVDAGPTVPTWDPAFFACTGAQACGPDTCNGNTLTSCANGFSFKIKCNDVQLSSCVTSPAVPTGPYYDPTEMRASCKP